jgi:hypothetical protein
MRIEKERALTDVTWHNGYPVHACPNALHVIIYGHVDEYGNSQLLADSNTLNSVKVLRLCHSKPLRELVYTWYSLLLKLLLHALEQTSGK